ncbi:hypothetical protein MBCUT_18040 [Methanobrevibacter cuticularis]|uniref:Uncharacterized protein n=1 Tax=Methanobrevibacter cuticularis TaxID=47311 RepID=A0A166CYM5_9EURY|nr:hypothetical protein [Methanobrevibacter cuticularis]KZX15002.1 hypothetical protein MBCUT_18040 [Methanobrevibacter cuticularis]
MVITTNNIKIKPDLLKAISRIAKRENMTETKVLNDIIEKGIESKRKNKIPEHFIANKDTYNSNPTKKELNSIVGIMEAPEGFDVVEAVNDARIRKWE